MVSKLIVCLPYVIVIVIPMDPDCEYDIFGSGSGQDCDFWNLPDHNFHCLDPEHCWQVSFVCTWVYLFSLMSPI